MTRQERLSQRLREREALGLTRRRMGLADHPHALAFCSNDYLGLAQDARLVEALAKGARQWGAGATASHLVCGHTPAHEALEEAFADWMQPLMPGCRALSFSSGYQANLAVLTALGEAGGRVVCDRLNHASLIDAMRLSEARHLRYQHGSLSSAATQMAGSELDAAPALLVTDGVFSMDGDLAPLAGLSDLAEAHGAWLVVDDAHGTGAIGPNGRGSAEHLKLSPAQAEPLVLIVTLGKAFGLAGAVVLGPAAVMEWLIQAGRSYIYTTATPPALAVAAQRSLEIVRSEEGRQRRELLAQRMAQLRAGLEALVREPHAQTLGWRLADSNTAIQPLIVGSNEAAVGLSQALLDQDIWVPAIRPPTVPIGQARLRISLNAGQSAEQVDQLLHVLWESLSAIPSPDQG